MGTVAYGQTKNESDPIVMARRMKQKQNNETEPSTTDGAESVGAGRDDDGSQRHRTAEGRRRRRRRRHRRNRRRRRRRRRDVRRGSVDRSRRRVRGRHFDDQKTWCRDRNEQPINATVIDEKNRIKHTYVNRIGTLETGRTLNTTRNSAVDECVLYRSASVDFIGVPPVRRRRLASTSRENATRRTHCHSFTESHLHTKVARDRLKGGWSVEGGRGVGVVAYVEWFSVKTDSLYANQLTKSMMVNFTSS